MIVSNGEEKGARRGQLFRIKLKTFYSRGENVFFIFMIAYYAVNDMEYMSAERLEVKRVKQA